MQSGLSTVSSSKHFTRSRWLSLALVAVLALPAAGFVNSRGLASPLGLTAQHPDLPASTGTLFVVNSTRDEDDAATGNGVCETAPGNGQCTLRAAIEEANTVVGAESIIFTIPLSDPGCTAGVCTINLGSALPDITDGVTITGPGPDNLTVRRDTGGDYYVLTVVGSFGHTETISGLTISNGRGGLQLFGQGTINVTN